MRRRDSHVWRRDFWGRFPQVWKLLSYEDSMNYQRSDNRRADEVREINIVPDFMPYAEGAALIEMGNTRVICTASIEDRVPFF
ncbi:MAG: hypothetical protein ACRD63_07035, partial [Pyrinomonadaceae bacterium]